MGILTGTGHLQRAAARLLQVARAIREVDMRASPYDLSALGYQPITIETPAGKAEYVAAQRGFAERGQVLRTRLLGEMSGAFAAIPATDDC